MNINQLIDQIGGRERIDEINADGFLRHGESKLMARALLAVLDAQDKAALFLSEGVPPPVTSSVPGGDGGNQN